MSYHANETVEVKTCDLIDAALDWAVAESQQMHVIFWGITKDIHKVPEVQIYHPNLEWVTYKPSTNWSQGGPIIEKNDIAIDKCSEVWCSSMNDKPIAFYHPTPLIAAMCCYVVSKLGDTVKIPKDLLLNSSK